MSLSGTPARSAIAIPSPVHACAFVVARKRRPAPPVQRIDGLRADRLQPAVDEVPADHALAAAVLDDQLPGEVLLVDGDVALHHLLVEHLDQDVAGDVGRVRGTRRAGGAERALCDLAVLRPREDAAPVLELVEVPHRLAREDLDRVLVAEVVGALDRVVGVDLRAVLAGVAERGVDPALGRAGVAPHRVELRDDSDVRADVECLDRGAHAGADRRRRRPRRASRPRERKLSDRPTAAPVRPSGRRRRPRGRPTRRTARSCR